MTDLAFTRTGRGEPLVLVHGIGGSKATWQPVVVHLAERFDVIAVDLPGFGDSPELPATVEPTPAALAAALLEFLDRLGVGPFHIAGNSLGGWVVLELARIREVRTVTLLSPAGLWRGGAPLYCRISLGASRWMARRATRLLLWAVATAVGRTVTLAQTHGRPWAMSADYARTSVRALAKCTGFEATMRATNTRRFLDGTGIAAPMTLAFGSRDMILLPRQSRHLDQLPGTVRIDALPRCGHVPMADDPPVVAGVITRGTQAGFEATR
ncbi:alpha/beta fold hydrolase [Phytohabitans sp. LJ34]|uniref:alpha/beta fold hydrolase n=1 Tax=Phytohabitans sp. LJ34 TaxID=3452217 RepID=UPI003F88859B